MKYRELATSTTTALMLNRNSEERMPNAFWGLISRPTLFAVPNASTEDWPCQFFWWLRQYAFHTATSLTVALNGSTPPTGYLCHSSSDARSRLGAPVSEAHSGGSRLFIIHCHPPIPAR